MYSVMIVDDERNAREGLKLLIEWEAAGFSVCTLAASAEEALRLMDRFHPDLVLTDIRMPRMSGIDLIRTIRSEGRNDAEFIILSGYAEFDYAQQAMAHSVAGYLLKPVEEKEILELLHKVGATIARKKREACSETRHRLNRMASGIILEPLQESTGWMRKEACNGLQVIRVDGRRPLLWTLDLSNTEEYGRSALFRLPEPVRDVFERFPEALLGENRGFLIRESEGMVDLIAGETLLGQYRHDVIAYSRMLHAWFQANDVETDVLIGDRVSGFPDLRRSMDSLDKRKESVFYGETTPPPWESQNMEPLTSPTRAVPRRFPSGIHAPRNQPERMDAMPDTAYADAFIAVIHLPEEGDLDRMAEKLHHYLCQLNTHPMNVRIWFKDLISRLILTVPSDNAVVPFQMYRTGSPLWDEMNLSQLISWIISFSRAIQNVARPDEISSGHHIVEKVQEYIHAHYTDNVELKKLSQRFYMNTAYLGQLFRKRTGSTLKQYVHRLRMEKAMNLLRHGNMKIFEIAQHVGFDNSNYFILRFTEYVGMAPREYRYGKDANDPQPLVSHEPDQ